MLFSTRPGAETDRDEWPRIGISGAGQPRALAASVRRVEVPLGRHAAEDRGDSP